jgi:hypothetical protein
LLIIFLFVFVIDRLNKDTDVIITPVPELHSTHHLHLRRQSLKLSAPSQKTVCISVRNATDRVVNVPRDTLLARAVLQTETEEPLEQSPGYRLQFLREYFRRQGRAGISEDGKVLTFGEAGGPVVPVRLHKLQRTNFRWGANVPLLLYMMEIC